MAFRATVGHDPAGPRPLTVQQHGDDIFLVELFGYEGKVAPWHACCNHGWRVTRQRTKETATPVGQHVRDDRTAAACPTHISSLTNHRLVPANVRIEGSHARIPSACAGALTSSQSQVLPPSTRSSRLR